MSKHKKLAMPLGQPLGLCYYCHIRLCVEASGPARKRGNFMTAQSSRGGRVNTSAAAPLILPSGVLGVNGAAGANDRYVIGAIGVGNQLLVFASRRDIQ